MTLAGRHAVVTGGGTGVGAAIAQKLAATGAEVTVIGRREEPLRATGLHYCVSDVTNYAALAAALQSARSQYGPIDIAIANAGSAESAPFVRSTSEDLRAMLAVNFEGVANLWRLVLPDMQNSAWGRLIAVASTAGLKGYAYAAGYCAAKHAVVGLVRALALEIARTGITANAICPGFIETPLLKRSVDKIIAASGRTRKQVEDMLRATNPQGRYITVEEVADIAAWLCSQSAQSVNGHALSVSGGEV